MCYRGVVGAARAEGPARSTTGSDSIFEGLCTSCPAFVAARCLGAGAASRGWLPIVRSRAWSDGRGPSWLLVRLWGRFRQVWRPEEERGEFARNGDRDDAGGLAPSQRTSRARRPRRTRVDAASARFSGSTRAPGRRGVRGAHFTSRPTSVIRFAMVGSSRMWLWAAARGPVARLKRPRSLRGTGRIYHPHWRTPTPTVDISIGSRC
jgi:hypothetical protein